MSSPDDNSNEPLPLENEKSHSYSFLKEGESRLRVSSVIILAFVTILAIIAGIIAIRILPSPLPKPINPPAGNEFRRTPPEWIGYSLDAAFPVEMDRLKALAVGSGGDILVGGDKIIQVYSHTHELKNTLQLDDEPQALILADKYHITPGRLYVAFRDRIEVFSPSFERIASWTDFNEEAILSSISLSEEEIFVADAGNLIVYVFSPEGRILRTIGQKMKVRDNAEEKSDENEAEFNALVVYATKVISVVYSPFDGLLRVTSPGRHRIETFTVQGHWEPPLSWGNRTNYFEGFSSCCNPVSIAMLSDGSIVAMETHALQRIKVYSTFGQLEAVVASTDDLENSPLPERKKLEYAIDLYPCVCTTPEGEIVVLDPTYGVVRVYKKKPDYHRP